MERHQWREGRGGRDRKSKFAVISPCSHLALILLFFKDGSNMRDIDVGDMGRRDLFWDLKRVWQTGGEETLFEGRIVFLL